MVHECVRFTLWQLTIKFITMSKIKFTYNKVYNYVTNTHPLTMLMDTIVAGLGVVAFTGIGMLIYHITVNGAVANFGIY